MKNVVKKGVRLPAARLFSVAMLIAATSCGSDGGPSDPNANGPNLEISAFYLVQSVQTRAGTVPLVAGKDAYARIFVVASAPNIPAPPVRLRLYQGGVLTETITVSPGAQSVPTAVDQSTFTNSWNVKIPGAKIQPGLQILADVDPGNAVAESKEDDNSFPASGSPLSLQIGALQTLRMRFVPMVQAENGLTGNVNASNIESYLTFAKKIHPVNAIDADLRAPYTVNGLGFDPQGNTWQTAVAELDAVRVAEGSDRFYYGVVNTEYNGGGVVGIAAGIPAGAALGWDRFPDAPITLAHEIGHDWGRFHAPCGGAGGADPSYPYPLGLIGAYGLDVETAEVKLPNGNTDIMGYCNVRFWISDYTYTAIFNYRVAHPNAALKPRVPSLVVWGSIENGVPKLEPAFEAVTTPTDVSPGPYHIEGVDSTGALVFSRSFGAPRMPDASRDIRHFAFAVPLSADEVARVVSLRVSANGHVVLSEAKDPLFKQVLRSAQDDVLKAAHRVTKRAGSLAVAWDTTAYPMVVVRDAETGAILSLARGGKANVVAKGNITLSFSDGIHSTRQRLP